MIDKKWLEQLSFDSVPEGRVAGLEGLGAHKVVFRLILEDGRLCVLKIRRHNLGLHINEIPPVMSRRPEYDLDRLNLKLCQQLGNNVFDISTVFYDRLYSRVLYIVSVRTIPGLEYTSPSMDTLDALRFLIKTPPFIRRLDEFANWPTDPENPLTFVPKVNGPESPIQLNLFPSGRVPPWITAARQAVESRRPFDENLDAGSVFKNPLVIWGAAAMEGFLTHDEMHKAAIFIKSNFGDVSRLPQSIAQVRALA